MGIILKILLAIIAIIVLITVWQTVRLSRILRKNSKERKPKEEIYNGEGEKNALVIYQPSPHGTVDSMAKAAALALQDMGYTVVTNYPGKSLNYDVSRYDVLAFGSAVYIGTVSEVLVDYIKSLHFEGKKVFLFAVGINVKEKKELGIMEKWIGKGNFISKVKVEKGEEQLIDQIVREQLKPEQGGDAADVK